jgi:hypothetical protein
MAHVRPLHSHDTMQSSMPNRGMHLRALCSTECRIDDSLSVLRACVNVPLCHLDLRIQTGGCDRLVHRRLTTLPHNGTVPMWYIHT